MKLFEDKDGLITIQSGRRLAKLSRAQFQSVEPKYNLPAKYDMRRYDSEGHFFYKDGEATRADDISTEQLNEWVDAIGRFVNLPEPTAPEKDEPAAPLEVAEVKEETTPVQTKKSSK